MASVTVCAYSGVVISASDILSRFIVTPSLVKHPLFEHPAEHILRIACNDTLTPIERRVVVAALIDKLKLVTFSCAILPNDFMTTALISKLARVVNKVAALPEKELKYYPKYVINDVTRDLSTFDSYLQEIETTYLYQTQGRITASVASVRMESAFQTQLDDAAKRFSAQTVNATILKWAFDFVEAYSIGNEIPNRTLALMALLEQHPQKSWKALYNTLNSRTRNLITKDSMRELREFLFDLIPDDLDSRPKRIVVIRYIDALIQGQQQDLMQHLADMGEAAYSQKIVKTVSGVSYLVSEVKQDRLPTDTENKPVRADYKSAVDFARALTAYMQARK